MDYEGDGRRRSRLRPGAHVIDLYDVFSPVALRNRRGRAIGPHSETILQTLAQVGATPFFPLPQGEGQGEGDIVVQVQGAAVQVQNRSLILTEAAPPEAYAWTALFLACETAERREGPFALYDTFSPTALRGKTALVDGTGDDLTDIIALNLARAGARVLSAAPLGEAVLAEAQALGRHVTPIIDPYETSPDIVVNLGQRGAHLAHKLLPQAMINIVPVSGWSRFEPEELAKALLLNRRVPGTLGGVRINAIGVTEASDPRAVARLVIFLASEAGGYIAGRCIPLQ